VRIVDIYSKGGNYLGYNSVFSLIPSSGIGFTILSAGGDTGLEFELAEVVLTNVFPAIEEATRQEVMDAGYTGRFSSGNSSIDLVLDERGNGLLVEAWQSRGIDFSVALETLSFKGVNESLRLYPSELVKVDGDTEEEDWRLVSDVPESSVEGVFSPSCGSWAGVSRRYYAGQQMDVLVVRKIRGKVVSIESPALRVVLKKE